MPLNFDAASLMAPGGIVSGLDDLGSAVTRALDRRAERRYASEAEKRRRGETLDDRSTARSQGLQDESRKRRFQWWHDAAAAGPEDEPGYMTDPSLTDMEKAQLEAIRQGSLSSRMAKAKAEQPLSPIVPPATTKTTMTKEVDDLGFPTGKMIQQTDELDLPTRVSDAMRTADSLRMRKGRGADAAAQLYYAQGGQDIVDTVRESAVPWQADEGPLNTFVAGAKEAFNAGETMAPGALAESLAAELAQAEAVSPSPSPQDYRTIGAGMDSAPKGFGAQAAQALAPPAAAPTQQVQPADPAKEEAWLRAQKNGWTRDRFEAQWAARR